MTTESGDGLLGRAGSAAVPYYIPAEQLEAAGIDPYGPVPWYKTWPGQRGRFIVVLYKEA